MGHRSSERPRKASRGGADVRRRTADLRTATAIAESMALGGEVVSGVCAVQWHPRGAGVRVPRRLDKPVPPLRSPGVPHGARFCPLPRHGARISNRHGSCSFASDILHQSSPFPGNIRAAYSEYILNLPLSAKVPICTKVLISISC